LRPTIVADAMLARFATSRATALRLDRLSPHLPELPDRPRPPNRIKEQNMSFERSPLTNQHNAAADRTGTGSGAALIAADRVRGTEVHNAKDGRLGDIDSILIDKASGQVAYVVMSFGGFLGIGERYHPLPWHVLSYDTAIGGYRVDLDRAALEAAPAFGRDEVDRYDFDRDTGGVASYYAGRGGRSPDFDMSDDDDDDLRAQPRDIASDDPMRSNDPMRSDRNDGRDGRPLGYFSSQAQADRSLGQPGKPGETNEAAGGPGFYSPEQQAARNALADATTKPPTDSRDDAGSVRKTRLDTGPITRTQDR
jgi:hypothetical protein